MGLLVTFLPTALSLTCCSQAHTHKHTQHLRENILWTQRNVFFICYVKVLAFILHMTYICSNKQ